VDVGVSYFGDMAPVRVAIVNDYEIVVAGVAGLLTPFRDRIEVVEMSASTGVITDVDVVLYDTFGGVQGDGIDLDSLVDDAGARVAVFSWNVEQELVTQALERGAWGYLSKGLTGEEIAKAIEAIHAGEVVTAPVPVDEAAEALAGGWPGRQYGLTHRESEVLALITQGLTNQEIADRAYISINSVKTYVRTAYRKIGAARRSQAVRWGMEHGFEPDRGRVVIDR
jgi:two-component system, NarL family, response regulator LiaR